MRVPVDRGKVIWLNGAFGVGKTTVARSLAANIPQALVFDPEKLGTVIEDVVPPRLRPTGDFQDVVSWRALTRTAVQSLVEEYARPLIVPMTLVDPRYFDEIVGELRRAGICLHHFALLASPKTIRRRLLMRLNSPAGTWWALRQVDRCATALQSPAFDLRLPTEGVPVATLMARIRRDVGL